jgi:hypothetical protein
MFLAVHFTLVHWPYFWSDAPKIVANSEQERAVEKYEFALARLDQQFAGLMEVLGERGALENAIVIALSDHGESLGEPSPIRNEDGSAETILDVANVYGHGTHVFSMEQYQVLLALRSYGETPVPTHEGVVISTPTSLEDIAPTILDAFGLGRHVSFDGRSFLADLRDLRETSAASPRVRFIETEFNPPGLTGVESISASSIREVIGNFQIDAETDRVSMRAEYLQDILKNRQYAAIADGAMLASVPASDPKEQHLIFVHRDSGRWRWLDGVPDAQGNPELRRLWLLLSERFEPVRARPVTPLQRQAAERGWAALDKPASQARAGELNAASRDFSAEP